MNNFSEMPLQMASLQNEVAELKQLILQLFNQSNDLQEVVGIDEVCKLTGYSKNTVYQYVNQKKIPFHKPEHGGRKLIFFKSEIENWLRGDTAESSGEYCERKDRELLHQYRGGLN